MQKTHISVTDMLTNLIEGQSKAAQSDVQACPECGLSWREFKDTGLLGCPGDYDHFSQQLRGVIESAQNGATHHTGKAPAQNESSAANSIRLRESRIAKLRQQLAKAVEKESYEEAARLRDEIATLEKPAR